MVPLEVFCGFPQYVHENSGYSLDLVHDCFLQIISVIVTLNIINLLMFIMETWCVFCLVGVEFTHII